LKKELSEKKEVANDDPHSSLITIDAVPQIQVSPVNQTMTLSNELTGLSVQEVKNINIPRRSMAT
jgi:hypothetical protein